MTDTRDYTSGRDLRGGPASSTASQLSHKILEAIHQHGAAFTLEGLANDAVSVEEISGQIDALVNLKLLEVEKISGSTKFSLTASGRHALENRYTSID